MIKVRDVQHVDVLARPKEENFLSMRLTLSL